MFIEEYPGLIPTALCESIIARFESSPARAPSLTKVDGVPTAAHIRTGTQLACDTPAWQDVINDITPALHASFKAYAEKYSAVRMLLGSQALSCTAPIIQRTDPGQGFNWHFDQTAHTLQRVIAGLLYLNTVDDGGATEFHEQAQQIKPETGKIALFPPFWTHLHQGATPARGAKYVMSFYWVYGP